jgi:hypothetical protein
VLVFVSFFAVLLLSNVVTALTTFYGAAEVTLLLAAPIAARRVHQVRFVETLAASSWMVLLFGMPAFVAYGVVYGAGPVFYLGTVGALVPFLVIPAALGVVAATVIVLLFRRARATSSSSRASRSPPAHISRSDCFARSSSRARPGSRASRRSSPTSARRPVPADHLGGGGADPAPRRAPPASRSSTSASSPRRRACSIWRAGLVERVLLLAWSRAQEGPTGGGRERALSRWMRIVTARCRGRRGSSSRRT